MPRMTAHWPSHIYREDLLRQAWWLHTILVVAWGWNVVVGGGVDLLAQLAEHLRNQNPENSMVRQNRLNRVLTQKHVTETIWSRASQRSQPSQGIPLCYSASIIFQKRWPPRRQVRRRPSRRPPAGRGPAPPPPAPTQARGGSSSTPPATTSLTGEFLGIREQPTSPSEAESSTLRNRCVSGEFRFLEYKIIFGSGYKFILLVPPEN